MIRDRDIHEKRKTRRVSKEINERKRFDSNESTEENSRSVSEGALALESRRRRTDLAIMRE
jgi:hypothetical protein